jgi:hypothetical protein
MSGGPSHRERWNGCRPRPALRRLEEFRCLVDHRDEGVLVTPGPFCPLGSPSRPSWSTVTWTHALRHFYASVLDESKDGAAIRLRLDSKHRQSIIFSSDPGLG